MKLQIDTENKTIKVDENVLFGDLVKVLNKLLPKEWRNYTLESNTTIYSWYPHYTYYYPTIEPIKWEVTCGATNDYKEQGGITTSIYNVEVLDNNSETILDDHLSKYSDVWQALAQ